MPDRITYADVVVVGAGPGGSTAAAHLASAGRDVVLVEKTSFPREKVCGDGLTPRAVKQLQALGLEEEAAGEAPGWRRSRGLRTHGGSVVLELPWPDLDDFPSHSLTCPRYDFDTTLARHAEKSGARLWERTEVVAPLFRAGDIDSDTLLSAAADAGARVSGVRWRDDEGRVGEIRAPVVIASDGASSRFAVSLGLRRRKDRPLAVAVRTYYENPREGDEWLSSFLDLRENGEILPGYGWVFPMADETVNIGVGILDTSEHFGAINYRDLVARWAGALPPEWGLTPDRQTGSILSGPLPMAFSRVPHHHNGVLLVGDAGGMINPFNGEGIAYAMEAGALAAEVADHALERRSTRVLEAYSTELRRRWGGYYQLGRAFAWLIGKPEVMHVCTEYGMPRPRLMELVMKLLANLTDEKPSDAYDVIVNALKRVAPAA